jgi:hypothetical protein
MHVEISENHVLRAGTPSTSYNKWIFLYTLISALSLCAALIAQLGERQTEVLQP